MNPPGRTRELILDAAERLFLRFGFKKTSIDDVAREARIGKGSVYLHFTSKEELFAEVTRRLSGRVLEALTAAVKRARSPTSKLRAFIETQLTNVATIAAEYRLAEETLLELLPLALEVRHEFDAQERALLVQILEEGVAAGVFAVEHPERLATGLMTVLSGLESNTLLPRGDAEIRAGVDEVVSVLVRGLTRRAERTRT